MKVGSIGGEEAKSKKKLKKNVTCDPTSHHLSQKFPWQRNVYSPMCVYVCSQSICAYMLFGLKEP